MSHHKKEWKQEYAYTFLHLCLFEDLRHLDVKKNFYLRINFSVFLVFFA